ncbi:50S ribosomal protein L24 [Candidatus Woesearchaeota archaeon]|nr:50S ribosomal protein L24 [Candidatus Woesearchaeota archaeon]
MKEWSVSWKSSKSPRKQRKYRFTAPIHVKRKFLSCHLASDLRKKYARRNIVAVVGDKAKVVRGEYKGHSGKVELVNSRKGKISVSGIDISKKDGTKSNYFFAPASLVITELNLDSKNRNNLLKRKSEK